MTPPLAPHATVDDPAAEQVAARAAATWDSMAVALAALVGHGGVEALYNRSIALAEPQFPWLSAAHGMSRGVKPFTALQHALSGQSAATATEAHAVLLRQFLGLLNALIGVALTQRILGFAIGTPAEGSLLQDGVK